MLPNTVKFYPFPELLPEASIGLDDQSAWLGLADQKPGLIYIHIPFCRFLCDYCPLYKEKASSKTEEIDSYIANLAEEMAAYARVVFDRSFDTIYFGGGTASMLSLKQLSNLVSLLNHYFNIIYAF